MSESISCIDSRLECTEVQVANEEQRQRSDSWCYPVASYAERQFSSLHSFPVRLQNRLRVFSSALDSFHSLFDTGSFTQPRRPGRAQSVGSDLSGRSWPARTIVGLPSSTMHLVLGSGAPRKFESCKIRHPRWHCAQRQDESTRRENPQRLLSNSRCSPPSVGHCVDGGRNHPYCRPVRCAATAK